MVPSDRKILETSYRPEIDGLRAVAVFPVVLYHAGSTVLSGGYVGVDVFFVISGFLITGILLNDIDRDRFSILTFYERRIRRIFPALFAVLLITTLLASQLLLWDEFNQYARSLFFATFFLANHYFMGDTGYFAGLAETKPLLHMWSLAVEEQFYIFFPVYLYVLARFRREWLLPVTVLLLLVSLAVCVVVTNWNPDTAFYIAPTRAWELLVGAVLAMLPARYAPRGLTANLLGLAGLAAIIWAILTFDHGTLFPGAAAIVPVLGTAAIIYATSAQTTLAGQALSLAPMRFIGLISYSLYLWHWPLLVFYRFWRLEDPPLLEMYGVVAFSVLVATVSWRFVEKPFRKRVLLKTRKSILVSGTAAMLVSGAVAGVIDLNDGFKNRYPAAVNAALSVRFDSWQHSGCNIIPTKPEGARYGVCQIGNGRADFAVWGDSHGGALVPAFVAASAQTGRSGVSLTNTGCVPLLGVNRLDYEFGTCEQANTEIFNYLSENQALRDVYLVSRWSKYAEGMSFEKTSGKPALITDAQTLSPSIAENKQVFVRGLARTIAALQGEGKRVFLVTQVPESKYDVPSTVARALWLHKDLVPSPKTSAYIEHQAFVTEQFNKAKNQFRVAIIPLGESMCDSTRCSLDLNGLPAYRDDHHLSIKAAQALAPFLLPYLSNGPTF